MTKITHEENTPKGRFVIYDNDEFVGEITYSWAGDKFFIIDHTLVEQRFGGKGYGKQLVMSAVEFARQKSVKILPLCTYAKLVFERDQSLNDIKHK